MIPNNYPWGRDMAKEENSWK